MNVSGTHPAPPTGRAVTPNPSPTARPTPVLASPGMADTCGHQATLHEGVTFTCELHAGHHPAHVHAGGGARWDTPIAPQCPECRQGKHQNCTGSAWDDRADELTLCACTWGLCAEPTA